MTDDQAGTSRTQICLTREEELKMLIILSIFECIQIKVGNKKSIQPV